ncbi:hypothetical protein RJ640_028657 [Escallonia rubra]|uniref:GAG-pre-integrase domain-containing protein n=1 Tax=Escallonia rubra TaxID=112253 RepID=A0AA88QSJ3_9ASTE|nr:hypothetical protein RJ640_028657 [Escallonia rubra]
MASLPAKYFPLKINYNTQKEMWKMSELIFMCVQEEERLKSEQLDGAHVVINGSSKGKGKKFGKGSMQGSKNASITKTDKARSSGTKANQDVKCLSAISETSWLWHRRLGHMHMEHLKDISSKELVRGLPKIKFEKDKYGI